MSRKAITDDKQRRRQHWAWYMYDFGNSAYAAVILLAVFSAYFKGQVVGGAAGSRLWGLALGTAMLVVAVLSPFLGAFADFAASKKRLLLIFSALSWIFTALLFFVQKGDVLMGFVFFVLAEIGYRGGQVFYNALLPEIASPDEIGQVSGKRLGDRFDRRGCMPALHPAGDHPDQEQPGNEPAGCAWFVHFCGPVLCHFGRACYSCRSRKETRAERFRQERVTCPFQSNGWWRHSRLCATSVSSLHSLFHS